MSGGQGGLNQGLSVLQGWHRITTNWITNRGASAIDTCFRSSKPWFRCLLAIQILGQCPISCGNTGLIYDHPRKVIMKSVLFLHCPKICELVYVVQ